MHWSDFYTLNFRSRGTAARFQRCMQPAKTPDQKVTAKAALKQIIFEANKCLLGLLFISVWCSVIFLLFLFFLLISEETAAPPLNGWPNTWSV